MSISEEPAVRLGWGIRRYWWSLLLMPVLLAGGGAAVWAFTDMSPEYEAHALVVATEVNLRGAELPPLVEAVFEAGTVAESAVNNADLPYDPQRLIPSYASAQPLADGLATRVTGRSTDPETAARIANAAADALVAELRQLGPSIATFRVHDRARAPLDVSNGRLGFGIHVAGGGLLGAVLALVAISVLLAVRRPLTHPQQVRSVLGVPVVGTARIPKRWTASGGAGGGHPARLRSLATRLVPDAENAVALSAVPSDESTRSQLAVLLGWQLAHGRPTTVVSAIPKASQAVEMLNQSTPRHGHETTSPPRLRVSSTPSEGAHELTIFDGEVVDVPEGEVRNYLVLREGTPRRAAELVAIDQPSSNLDGVIWVRRPRRTGARRRTAVPGGPTRETLRSWPGRSTEAGQPVEGEPRRAGQHQAP